MTCPDSLCKPRPNRALFFALVIAAVSTGAGIVSSYQLGGPGEASATAGGTKDDTFRTGAK